jgi:hypothetical protein
MPTAAPTEADNATAPCAADADDDACELEAIAIGALPLLFPPHETAMLRRNALNTAILVIFMNILFFIVPPFPYKSEQR